VKRCDSGREAPTFGVFARRGSALADSRLGAAR
jgi:hypothetical protein